VLWPRADLVTAVGTFVEQDIQRHTGIGPDQTMVLYSPILDAEIERLSEEPVEHPWFQESTPIVLCVARFEPVKDHRTPLQGFAKLRETHEARLVLLGDGTIREDLEEQVQALDLADTVWFAGFVDNPFRYMKRSSMLVLTSLREGVPGVVVQAMACGLPVIGTDSPGGTGELVQNEHTGLLIPMSDPEALAHAMRRLVDDPAFAGRLVEEARSSIDRFEVDPALEGYERSLLSNDA